MKKSNLLKTFLLATAAGGFALSANAQVIFADNFDGYANQADFEDTWPLGAGTTGTWSDAQAFSGTHSISNSAGGTHMNAHTFSASVGTDIFATDANPLVQTFRFYDDPNNIVEDANVLGRSYVQLLARDSEGDLAQLISFGHWNAAVPKASDGTTATTAESRLYYHARIAFGAQNWVLLDTGPERSAGWHEFQVVIGSTVAEFFINGVSVYSNTYIGTEGAAGFYQARIGSGLSSGTATAFDDYNLEIIPEPGTYAAIFGALALLGAIVYRRRLTAKK